MPFMSDCLEVARRLGMFATPTLFEALPGAVAALSPEIAPLYRPISLAGVAFTVLSAPGDNLSVHWALAEAPAGSVLVVSAGIERRCGMWGEVMTAAAQARGIAGLVTDASVRDRQAVCARQFPIFCSGLAIAGTTKRNRGVLNEPVVIGGVLVQPGNFIIGDDDGVVVVPAESASELIQRASARVEKEKNLIRSISEGALTIDLLNLRKTRSLSEN